MKTDSRWRFLPPNFSVSLGAVLLFAGGTARLQAQDDNAPVDFIEQALASDMADRQRAALVLIPDLVLSRPQAEKLARHIDKYLNQTADEQGKVLALQAYGKLPVPAVSLAPALKSQLTSGSIAVRRAAATALANAASYTGISFGKPALGITGAVESIGLVGGASTTFLWLRAQVETAVENDATFTPFSNNAKKLLPLCSLALHDADDRVKIGGADGIRAIARGIAEDLPDNLANTADNKTDPNELKVRLYLLGPVLASLNEEAPSLSSALTADRLETRIAGTKAVDAVAQARNVARANQLLDTPTLSAVLDRSPPDDPLQTCFIGLLPQLARRLQDDSPAERLIAMETFEHLDNHARSQLEAIVYASTDSNLFVRWVACRSLGRMLPGAKPTEADRIVNALRDRVGDADLDVKAAALLALGKGGPAGRPATGAVLDAVTRGDPDLQVLAIDTLERIEAERSRTVPVVKRALFADSDRLRKAGIAYLGHAGKAAKDALPELRRLLLDPDIEIRKEAAKSLLAIEKEL